MANAIRKIEPAIDAEVEYVELPDKLPMANVFYRAWHYESVGRGTGLIMESCRWQNLPTPEITVVPTFVNLTIWFKHSLTRGVKVSAPHVEEPYTQSDADFT